MKGRWIVPTLCVTLGVGLMTAALIANASPYVDVAAARTMDGTDLHVAGKLVPGTLKSSPKDNLVAFELKDEKGAIMPVSYKGIEPGNLQQTDKIVAIGGFQDKVFVANKLLVKCPSKYESTKKEPAN
ncbi:MAG: cytochrome c maturation protein CcmE [Chthonomonas sp.]|nr:cytochrome c maturation protein CcmE [Chthonomonas sp.]